MAEPALDDLDLVIKTMATTIVDNAEYFAQLDSIVGDGDFGFSLRNGFEVVVRRLRQLGQAERRAPSSRRSVSRSRARSAASAAHLGHRFPAGGRQRRRQDGARRRTTSSRFCGPPSAASSNAASRDLGDKTLLDALVPAVDSLEASFADPATARDHGVAALQQAADVAVKAAEDTEPMIAKRGRAAYTGERSIGSVDAGATAIGVIFQASQRRVARAVREVTQED